MTVMSATIPSKGRTKEQAEQSARRELRKRRMRRVRGLAFFAALAPFMAAISIGGYALVNKRQDILLWTLVPWLVCALNIFAYVWAPRKLRVSRAIILWSVFGGLTISVLGFGTDLGGMTLFLAWTILLAAMLYGPGVALLLTGLSVLVVIIAFVLELFYIVPWIPLDADLRRWGNFFLGIVYPIAVAGSVYMYSSYILDTLLAASARLQEQMNLVIESAQQQAAAAQQQAATVQEISATAEELSRTAEQIAASSDRLNEIATHSYQQVEKGEQVIGTMLDSVQHVAEEIQKTLQHALQMREHSQRIGEIVDFITRISDETHLIALNAAIEAASAGEHGQRFSVIAAEIRRLAEHAISSGDQIKGIIRDFQQVAQSIVMSMESEVHRVELMEQQAISARHTLQNIVDAAEKTQGAAQELAQAAADLRSVSQQLAQGLHEMTEAADNLAASSQQTLQIAHALEEEAETIMTSGV